MNRRTAMPTRRRRPTPHLDHCPMSGKIRYRDAREATDALHTLRNKAALADALGGQHQIRVARKYRCNACRGWHLTSQETLTAGAAAQPGPATDSAPAVPAPRGSDPLLSALARCLGPVGSVGVDLAA